MPGMTPDKLQFSAAVFSSDSFHYMSSFPNVPQGEDGFPGAKGDMGIKGDQVSAA